MQCYMCAVVAVTNTHAVLHVCSCSCDTHTQVIESQQGAHTHTHTHTHTPYTYKCVSQLPFFGVVPIILDAEGQEITDTECSGYLAIRQSWPGQMRTIYGDHHRFEQTYFTLYNAENRLISDRFYITGA